MGLLENIRYDWYRFVWPYASLLLWSLREKKVMMASMRSSIAVQSESSYRSYKAHQHAGPCSNSDMVPSPVGDSKMPTFPSSMHSYSAFINFFWMLYGSYGWWKSFSFSAVGRFMLNWDSVILLARRGIYGRCENWPRRVKVSRRERGKSWWGNAAWRPHELRVKGA